jgi:uncharacterized protein YjbJ (UPF0337 family)
MKVLTNSKQYKAGKIKAARTETVTPRMLLMPMERIRAYATVSLGKLHEEAGRLTDVVERSIVGAADEAAALGTKTTAF